MLNAVWFVLAGMAIVFGTLSVLVAVMMGFNRWLGPDPEAVAPGPGRPEGRGDG